MNLQPYYQEHRPLLHFTPPAGWMNDPNGLIYAYGYYHLFYQHNPHALRHGPMYWGHARSRTLLSWEHLPIALSPDALGDIFSGSAVLDTKHVSGLGDGVTPPLLLFFTHHRYEEGKGQIQVQSMAYSADQGATFHAYARNPIITLDGEPNFRDPKVFWHEDSHAYIMLIAAGHRLVFYHSVNLLDWVYLSAFTPSHIPHRGIIECPDLIQLDGLWILLFSLTATKAHDWGMLYKTGYFDGKTFTPDAHPYHVLDSGRDHYAAVTFSGLPDERRILLGYMNCWKYAQEVPAASFRGAMTLPRALRIVKISGVPKLAQYPITGWTQEKEAAAGVPVILPQTPFMLSATFRYADFTIAFTNAHDKLMVSFDGTTGTLLCDRSLCGDTTFSPAFDTISRVCIEPAVEVLDLQAIIDVTSIELFMQKGTHVITAQFFTDAPFSALYISAHSLIHAARLQW